MNNKPIYIAVGIGTAVLFSSQLKTVLTGLLTTVGGAIGDILGGALGGITAGTYQAISGAVGGFVGVLQESWDNITYTPESNIEPSMQYQVDFLSVCWQYGFNVPEGAVMLNGLLAAEDLAGNDLRAKVEYYISRCKLLNSGWYPDDWNPDAVATFRFTTSKKISPQIVHDTLCAALKWNISLYELIQEGYFDGF
jgi:hypothetical protein